MEGFLGKPASCENRLQHEGDERRALAAGSLGPANGFTDLLDAGQRVRRDRVRRLLKRDAGGANANGSVLRHSHPRIR